jgi:hypothetical protein
MCATPRPERKKVLGTIARDIAAISALANIMSGIPSVVGALPTAQAKKDWAKIAGAHKPVANAVAAFPAAVGKKAGADDGAPAPVAKASKALGHCEEGQLAPCGVLHTHPPRSAAGLGETRHGMQHGLMSKLGCEGMEGWHTPNVCHPF